VASSGEPAIGELRALLHRWPRLAAAGSFGASTALLTHFAWYPSARMNGMIPALTLAAGLAHAIGGALTGPRLLDPRRTRTALHAALLGAATSLLAVAIFAPVMAAYVSVGDVSRTSPLAYVMLTLYTGLFAFLGAGWALLVLSAAVGLALHRLAGSSAAV
jgi:hypothetical protein